MLYLSDKSARAGYSRRAFVRVRVYARETSTGLFQTRNRTYPARHEGYCPIRDSSSAPIERLQPGLYWRLHAPDTSPRCLPRARSLYYRFSTFPIFCRTVPLKWTPTIVSENFYHGAFFSPRQREYSECLRLNRKLPSCRSDFIKERLTYERAYMCVCYFPLTSLCPRHCSYGMFQL